MEETLSPNPNLARKQRLRFQSPTTPFFLGSNDDQLERAQARAARVAAASVRPKNIAANVHSQSGDADSVPCLDKQHILELLHNCIKLASENKINQKNTWELNLIDHLTYIIKVDEEGDVETNFQKASCTLEAGVKIYSLRVDSVHSEAYKVLGGMNRAALESEQDIPLEEVNVESTQEGGRKEMDKRLSPLSTLESSFEVLNVKKFDAAFVVDPLYRQTSAQFDEGGAKGLLMNNLGIYGGCRVLFDSMEVPAKCMISEYQQDISDTIDLSFARECVEQMVLNMHSTDEISPTLRIIVNQFDENNRRPSDLQLSGHKSVEEFDAAYNCDIEVEGEENGNCAYWSDDHDEQTIVTDLGFNNADSCFPSHLQEDELFSSQDLDVDNNLENVDGYLLLSLGFSPKQNAWAGPEHWKFRKVKGPEVCPSSEDESIKTRQTRSRRPTETDLDFTGSLDKKMPDIFLPPKNPKSLLLPENRLAYNTKLPEDCHYQPGNLVKLFLLPNVMCLGRRVKKFSDESREQCDDDGSFPSWGDASVCGVDYDGDVNCDLEDLSTLVSQPRQVNKIEVQYDKTSRQVDVQALKHTLWEHIQELVQLPSQGQKEIISFRQVLANFPNECNAAATISNISPHLCFICLLHLANENGLSIYGCPKLDDLRICLPQGGTTN